MYEMNKTNRGTWKKVLLIFLTAVFVLLTAASSIFVLCCIPINLTYEEAIEDIRFEDGILYVTRTDRVTGGGDHYSNLEYTGYRCRLWYNTLPESKLDRKVAHYSVMNDVWYLGYAAHGEDVLLYDLEGAERYIGSDSFGYLTVCRTIEYIFYIALVVGFLLFVTGLVIRKKKTGKVLLSVAILSLLLAVSCAFVTGGRMRYVYYNTFMAMFDGMALIPIVVKYVAIAMIALFSWGACMSAAGLVRQFRKR